MIIGFDHVQLAAPPGSEEQLRGYYVGILGMTELRKPPVLAARGGCWFQSGPVQLHLGIEDPFVPAKKAHPALRVDDIHGWAQRIAGHGAPVTWDYDNPAGLRFYSADPVGNRIEFLGPAGGADRG